MKLKLGYDAKPFTSDELELVRKRVANAIEFSRRTGIHCNDAHPMLPRLIATIDELCAEIRKLYSQADKTKCPCFSCANGKDEPCCYVGMGSER